MNTHTLGSDEHPLVPFQRGCSACELKNEKAVNGCGPTDLNLVRLIVISDHSGHYETESNHTFVSNDDRRQPRINQKRQRILEGFRNAGSVLRYVLKDLFDLDIDNEVWLTNVIKCDPAQIKPQEKHAKACVKTWLKREMAILDQYCPTVPVLIAGTLAYKGLLELDSELKKTLPKLRDCHRTNHFRLGQHPLIFTNNPATVAKEFRIESAYMTKADYSAQITDVKTVQPIIGSPIWHFRQDLTWIPLPPSQLSPS